MRTRTQRLGWAASVAALTAAMTPWLLAWIRRVGASRRTVNLRTTVIVERPLAEVFDFCHDFENFPRIVDLHLSVEDSQDGKSHWAIRSSSGTTVEWDATVTKYVPNSVIAWESVPGSPVQASGLMRFFHLGRRETRVDIALTYAPSETRLSEALRALVTKPNNDRVRREIVQASQELANR